MSSAQNTPSIGKPSLAFIGGGNMANAMLGGLIQQGMAGDRIHVVEPVAAARAQLSERFHVHTLDQAGPELAQAGLVIWAVKPQNMQEATAAAGAFCPDALHLSVAAGIRSDSLAQWLHSERIVRAMPNTPALVGLGQTGLFARTSVSATDRQWVEQVVATTGQFVWVKDEPLLDAVTAISGSGPAYVFFFMEAMMQAGERMGLSAEQARQLAVGTFVGSAELARSASESPSVLRERVTSKGGTTHAAISTMQAARLDALFQEALEAARQRAKALGDEFGK